MDVRTTPAQGVMQLPSYIVLLRYLEFLLHAHVPGTFTYTWDEPFTVFFLYFMLYAASTVVFQVCTNRLSCFCCLPPVIHASPPHQAVAFVCTARVYIIATAVINLACSVLSIWSNFTYASGMKAIFFVTATFSSMWAPLYGYIFLDTNVSVSEVRCPGNNQPCI